MEPLLFGLLLTGASLAMLSPVELRRRVAARALRSAHAVGRVIGIEHHHRSTADETMPPLLVPRVCFESGGARHEFLARQGADVTAPAVGTLVALRFDPDHPETAELVRRDEEVRSQLALAIAGAAGILLTAVALALA